VKKVLILCSIIIVLMLAACGDAADYYDEQDDPMPYVPQETIELDEPDEPSEAEESEEPDITKEAAERTLDFIPSIDLDVAAELFAIVQAIWDEDDGQLIGVPLHAPLMISDVLTRHAVTNQPDAFGQFIRHGDVYVGIVPENIFVGANPATVSGTLWGTAGIEYYMSGDFDKTDFIRLLIHEGFHAIQDYIISGQIARGNNFVHFNEAEARISAVLEIEALFAALRSDGDERLTHIHNALSLRNSRRYGRSVVGRTENQHEINEGLAMLAEYMLVSGDTETALEWLESAWTSSRVGSRLNISSGYYSGVLYAMLLNETDADWISGISYSSDLGQLLQDYHGINELRTLERHDLEQYGYSTLAPIERAWAEHRQEIIAWSDAAIDGSRVVLAGHNFITNFVIFESILLNRGDGSGHFLFYGYFVVEGANYILELRGGVIERLLMPDRILVGDVNDITVDDSQTRATAPTWTLEITDEAYKIEQLDNGQIRIVTRD